MAFDNLILSSIPFSSHSTSFSSLLLSYDLKVNKSSFIREMANILKPDSLIGKKNKIFTHKP